jgi:hypothetical protein
VRPYHRTLFGNLQDPFFNESLERLPKRLPVLFLLPDVRTLKERNLQTLR